MTSSDNASSPADLGQDLLMTMEVAVLRRLSPGEYQLYGRAPYFYTQLFPQQPDGSHCRTPWQYSPMLEFFLSEAETFFDQTSEPGLSLSSGIWLEEIASGENVPLAATARILPGAQVVLIQAARESQADQVRIVRKAKVEKIERRRLAKVLNGFKKNSLYDSLTKLYNQAAFLDILQTQIADLRTYTPNLALLLIDLDNFRLINENISPVAGDSVLAQMGELLRRSLRRNDAPARLAGQKFAVIAPNTSLPQSLLVAEKLRQAVAGYDFGFNWPVTASLGCTIYRPGEDSRGFILRADSALLEAKRAGKNKVSQRDPWTETA